MSSPASERSTDSVILHWPNTKSDYCGGQLEYFERFGSDPKGYEWAQEHGKEDARGDQDSNAVNTSSPSLDMICDLPFSLSIRLPMRISHLATLLVSHLIDSLPPVLRYRVVSPVTSIYPHVAATDLYDLSTIEFLLIIANLRKCDAFD